MYLFASTADYYRSMFSLAYLGSAEKGEKYNLAGIFIVPIQKIFSRGHERMQTSKAITSIFEFMRFLSLKLSRSK